MKIQFKLILVGFVVIALLMAAVGFMGISATNEVAKRFDEIADETTPALLALGKIEAAVNKIQVEALGFVLIEGEKEVAAADISDLEEAKENLEFWEDEFAKVAEDELEQGFVEEIEEHEVSLYNAAMALVRAKQEGKQGQIMLDLKERLEEEEKNFEVIIGKIIENEQSELAEQNEATDAAVATATTRILTVGIIVSALLALGMGVFVSRSVSRPLKELQHIAAQIIAGDYTVRAKVTGKDEIGELAASFNAMTDSLIEARKLPENILRSMRDSLFVVDTKGNITEANQAALEALGYKKEELLGKPISTVLGSIKQKNNRTIEQESKPIKYVPAPENEQEDDKQEEES